MAGTRLDFDYRKPWVRAILRDRFVFRKTGGRHWTRTSDLLHVKQVRRENAPLLTSTAPVRRLYLHANGWTSAGLPIAAIVWAWV